MPSLVGRCYGLCLGGSFRGEVSPETCLGKTKERISVPVVNERQRQTYFGALNYCTQEFLVKAYTKGNSDSPIEFLNYLQQQYPQQRLALFWDAASASIVPMNSMRICLKLMETCRNTVGKLSALDLLLMLLNRIQSPTSG